MDLVGMDVILNHQVKSQGQDKYSDLLTLCPTSSLSHATRPTNTQRLLFIHKYTQYTHSIHHHTSDANIFVYKSEFILPQTELLLLLSSPASPRAAVVL